MRHFKIQLANLDGIALKSSGGRAYVTLAGGTAKLACLDSSGAALTNPVALTNGVLEFWTADTVASVDLYIQTGLGHFVVKKAVAASGPNAILVDTTKALAHYVIPFNIADTTATTETSTGFTLPANSAFLGVGSGLSVDIKTLESGKTIDFGTAEAIAETGGDADGMASALSTTTAVVVLSAVTTPIVTATHVTITYTLSSGAVAAAGFLKIPVMLPAASIG